MLFLEFETPIGICTKKAVVEKTVRKGVAVAEKIGFYTKNKYFFIIPLAILRKVCYNVIELLFI